MELVLSHRNKTTVIYSHNRIGSLLAADDAREVDGSPHTGRECPVCHEARFIDRIGSNGEKTFHPPWTGGTNDT